MVQDMYKDHIQWSDLYGFIIHWCWDLAGIALFTRSNTASVLLRGD